MKKKNIHKKFIMIILGLGISTLIASCLKNSDPAVKPSLAAIPFKGGNLAKVLQGESALTLFYQAFNRLELAGSIDDNTGYTIFAPTDSVMKAAGLDAAGINSLNIDSLRKLISYQIAIGAFDDKALMNSVASTQVSSFLQDLTVGPNSGGSALKARLLFISENSALCLNGIRVSKAGPAIAASNGYIYPVKGFITNIPVRSIYNIITSNPDLSLYNQALMIGDSVRYAALGYDDGSGDVPFFSNPPLYTKGMLPTVFAPTNKAFNDAGFHTADDLRKLATRSYVGYDPATYSFFNYSALDSVLKRHIIYNVDVAQISASTVRVFYSDLLNTAINNNIDNSYKGGLGGSMAFRSAVPLVFSNQSGTVNIKWSNAPLSPLAILPVDVSPQHPTNNFVASNGALYKIDKLFYPAVK